MMFLTQHAFITFAPLYSRFNIIVTLRSRQIHASNTQYRHLRLEKDRQDSKREVDDLKSSLDHVTKDKVKRGKTFVDDRNLHFRLENSMPLSACPSVLPDCCCCNSDKQHANKRNPSDRMLNKVVNNR